MTPNVDETPFPAHALSPKTVVFDTVYNPPETRLLREAKAAGCRTISGVDMFIEQAVAQFELWTGQTAPRTRMAAIVRAPRREGLMTVSDISASTSPLHKL